ncbi:kelch repeat and BTB domain-containing protein 12-like isoform X2 [Nelusetta ayraudi]|uniref:kelch repeat and BTB domain-containing protein 12-like isoform X2 n=1 Tax=Nelusetta ayraudi TaxID=303726 RepID=UPI003F6E5C33
MDDAPGAGGAQEEHGSLLLRQLEKMRLAEELTDVVLLAEGVPFPCHRVVLSAFSPFFQAMFTCGLRETAGGAEVPLRDTPAASLQLLLTFMYRGRLSLSNHNIQQVAAAAFLLHVDGAFRLCESHMLAQMEPSNCVGVYQWARALGAASLADHALTYTCQHFTQVCNEEEILELDAQSLGELLALDGLNVSEEQQVLELVMRWARRRSGDPQSEAEAAQLLRRVRLELVEPEFLHKARRRNPVLLLGTECVGGTDAAHLTSGPLATSAPGRPALRFGMEATELLLCLGGVVQGGVPARRGGLADLSFCFSPRSRKTFYIPSPLRACGGQGQLVGGVVTPDNHVLVAVQAQDQHRQQRLDFYRYDDGEQSSWVALCSAAHREMFALGQQGGALYLTGGQMRERHQQVVTASVLRWSLSRGDGWLPSAPLPLPLACHSAVSLQGELYVLGGWTPQAVMRSSPRRSWSWTRLTVCGRRWRDERPCTTATMCVWWRSSALEAC